jgi:hypothetical protein
VQRILFFFEKGSHHVTSDESCTEKGAKNGDDETDLPDDPSGDHFGNPRGSIEGLDKSF